MDILNSMKEVITRKPSNLSKPHFYKADSDSKMHLEQLKEYLKVAPDPVKKQIEQDIKMLSYGISGEEAIAFELNNSYLPIIVLHDLYIEYEGLSAQIDYMIFTNKFILIIECKNLVGNIEVNSSGDFIRTIEYNNKYIKEGIYSPITQNKRHIEMIKRVRASSKTNFITKTLFEKGFDENYKSVVVLANPKTVINMKYAKKEIKDQIIRSDQLISYIKNLMRNSNSAIFTEKQMYELADFFLGFHTVNTQNYTKKYEAQISTTITPVAEERKAPVEIGEPNEAKEANSIEDTPIYKELKKYRYDRSVAEGIKAYYIYNNAQMEAIIAAMPTTIDSLMKLPGFGTEKCKKYGSDIVNIIKKYR